MQKKEVDSWYQEQIGPGRGIALRVREELFCGTENFPELGGGVQQEVKIVKFHESGGGLIINSMVQLTEASDPTYTGALVLPAALAVESPKRWLIAGGGDGAAAREALSFRGTKRVVLVDISRLVVEETQRFIPSFWNGRAKDSRLEVVHMDIFQYLEGCQEEFDVILSDLVDPRDGECNLLESPAERAYTSDGQRLFAKHLAPGGAFTMQAQELSRLRWEDHKRLRRMLQGIYPSVFSYRSSLEDFGFWESFLVGSPLPIWDPIEIPSVRHGSVERALIELGYTGNLQRYYSGEVHRALFALPPCLQAQLLS